VKQTITVIGQFGVPEEVEANVKGGLAIRRYCYNAKKKGVYDLIVVACGKPLVIDVEGYRQVKALRDVLLDTAIPWGEIDSYEAFQPYSSEAWAIRQRVIGR
jgi:hypothetical protein